MRRILWSTAMILVLCCGAVAALVWRGERSYGIDGFWTLVAGPADQGPVSFATLRRRSTPNDALVCPRSACAAVPDIAAPVYRVPAERLAQLFREAILATPHAVQVASAAGENGDRFVVRTPLLRFPDTVEVLVIPRDAATSTVAIYSRSLIGRSDMGANLRRIRAWLADPALVAVARTPD
jgi:uncharacterized protein (DUF1499 family)